MSVAIPQQQAEVAQLRYHATYLLSCLTMGLDLLVPLYKATAAASKCLTTDIHFSAETDLREFFKKFVSFLLTEEGNSCLDVHRGSALRAFFSAANIQVFNTHVYPPLATGVIRPLDAVRRSIQAVEGHPQLYISGKLGASQPLLCRAMGITHILRCYALPHAGSLPYPASDTRNSFTSSPVDMHRERHNAGLKVPSHLPPDAELISAALGRGGDWLTAPSPSPKTKSVAAQDKEAGEELDALVTAVPISRCHYDQLEYPVAMLRAAIGGSVTTTAAKVNDLEVYSVRRMSIPAVDDEQYDISQHFTSEVFGFISGAIASGGKVLVHCAAGKHRSAAVACAYLIDLQVPERVGVGVWHGTSLPPSPAAIVSRCYAAIQVARPMAEPTLSYQRQLETFAAKTLADH